MCGGVIAIVTGCSWPIVACRGRSVRCPDIVSGGGLSFDSQSACIDNLRS